MTQEVLTALGTMLGMAVIVILRDYRDGKTLFKKNGTNDISQAIKTILNSQSELKEHYNEDTTKILSDIRDSIKELAQIHKNYEIIGINTRDCAKIKT